MKILAVDPGYERLGLAILEKDSRGGQEILIASECFKTSSKLPHPERLGLIKKRLEEKITEHRPEALAIEKLFFAKNQKTALLVAEARGAIISTAQTAGLSVFEFTPSQIKSAVTGHGSSDKTAIIKMVEQLIRIEKTIKHDDEYDAIAVGLTFFATKATL